MNTYLIEFAKNGFELANNVILASLNTQQVLSPILNDAISFLENELADCSTSSDYTDVIIDYFEQNVSIDAVIQRINLQVDLTEKLSTQWHRDISTATVMKEKAQDLVENLPYYDNGLTACLATINLCIEVLQSKESKPNETLQIGQLSQLYKKAHSSCHTLLEVSEIVDGRKRRSQATEDKTNYRDHRLQMINAILDMLEKRDSAIADNKRRNKSAVNIKDTVKLKPYKKDELTSELETYFYKKISNPGEVVKINWLEQLIKQAYEIRALENISTSF